MPLNGGTRVFVTGTRPCKMNSSKWSLLVPHTRRVSAVHAYRKKSHYPVQLRVKDIRLLVFPFVGRNGRPRLVEEGRGA